MLARWLGFALITSAIGGGFWLARIRQSPPTPSPQISTQHLSQDVYIWQRDWTPSVRAAVATAASRFRHLVILAAEISLRGQSKITEIHPDYSALRNSVSAIGLAMRIGHLPAASSAAMDPDSPQTILIRDTAAAAVSNAHRAGLQVSEFQIDFDCAESKLSGYLNWVKAVKVAVSPVPVVITALPSWLKHREFADLAKEAGSYVLQVHSLHKPDGPNSPLTLCDPDEATSAVNLATKIGVPFRVALPTYTYLAGFSADGKLLGLSAEGPEPSWPPGTILRLMRSDPDAIANLVRQWSSNPPPSMTGLIWYRLPIPGDTMNWRQITLDAVMAGRSPKPNIVSVIAHPMPALFDIYLRNDGQADGSLENSITISWNDADLLAAEGLGGFEHLDAPSGNVTFRPSEFPAERWIAPGDQIQVGWLRLTADKEVQAHVSPLPPN